MDVIKEGECHKKFTLKFELQLLGEFLIEPLREEKKKKARGKYSFRNGREQKM